MKIGPCILLALTAAGCTAVSFSPTRPSSVRAQDGWLVAEPLRLVRQSSTSDCGEAAIRMVFEHWQLPMPAQVGTKDGTTGAELRRLVRAAGLDAFLIRGNGDDLRADLLSHHPALVGIVLVRDKRAYPHYAVVAALHPGRNQVLLADPARGWLTLPWSAFEKEWAAGHHLLLVTCRPFCQ